MHLVRLDQRPVSMERARVQPAVRKGDATPAVGELVRVASADFARAVGRFDAIKGTVGGEPSLPLAALAIVAWQGAIALAEEVYYRGLLESAGVLILSWPLRASGADVSGVGALALVEGVPLVLVALLFGLVHAEFVDESAAPVSNDDGVTDTKGYWFRTTALYSALYSALYVASGHGVLAPVCCHAGCNVGLCLRDWGRMRRTPPGALRRVFAVARGRDTFGLD
jgi:membrane protease YdiL (CAAX protease family)